MYLTVRAEGCTTVTFRIKFVAEYNFAWAETRGDAIVHGEVVKPQDDVVEEIDQHDPWETSVREGAYDAAASFLDHPYTSFNVADVFRCHSSIESSLLDVIADFFKFVVHEDGLYFEACARIDIDYSV